MEFSVGIGREEPLDEIADLARVAEECGYDQMTLVDQQNLSRDVYVMMAVVAQNTKRIKIGQGVTVPATRHPSVTINATASIDELSNGRAFLGIGAGGNALRSMGKKARPMKDFRETVEFIRQYMTGGEAEYQGARMHSDWLRKPIPIYMACTGPASCRMAGELADGAIIGPGVHPEVFKWRMELIREGALKAGRDPASIDIWVRTMVVVAESREAARREASAYGPRTVWRTLGLDLPEVHQLRRRLEPLIPDLDGFIEEGRRVHDAYDDYLHEKLDSPHSQMVTQRMVDFLHLTGTPDDICERIEELRELGAKNISGTLFTAVNKKEQMRLISTEIMPRFRQSASPAASA